MIEIRDLSKNFGNLEVLHDISLDVEDSAIFGLVGESGQGKSTLLRCINGLIDYNAGSLKIDGVEVHEQRGAALREFRKDIGMIFQSFSLLDRATVYDNIAFPMRLWKYDEKRIKEQIKDILDVVDLGSKITSFPDELSGGQKQRVAIARALVMQPHYLLSDEATSALDPKTGKSILNLLVQINREMGVTILLVTHQMEVVRQACDAVAVLNSGTIELKGPVKDIFLHRSESLNRLMGEEFEEPSPGMARFRICVSDKQHASAFFYRFKDSTGFACDFVKGGIEEFKEGPVFFGVVEVPEEKTQAALAYFDENGIGYEELAHA